MSEALDNEMLESNAEITFQIRNEMNDDDMSGEDDSLSPYVSLTRHGIEESLANMLNGDEIVIDKPTIRVVFSYPLQNSGVMTIEAPSRTEGRANFSRADLARAIALKYQQIYDEEANASVESMAERAARQGQRCMLINRAQTNGPYRIGGHELGDLLLHTVTYNAENDVYHLGIDS